MPGIPCGREDQGVPLQCSAVPGVRLMLQPLLIQGETFNLVVPADIDAIMDNYIALGSVLARPSVAPC